MVTYLLDLAGNKTRTTWADGYYVTYAYDALNRMTTAAENGTFLLSTYIYDTLSRRTSLVYGNGAAQGYTYSTQGDLLTLASTLTGTSNTYNYGDSIPIPCSPVGLGGGFVLVLERGSCVKSWVVRLRGP